MKKFLKQIIVWLVIIIIVVVGVYILNTVRSINNINNSNNSEKAVTEIPLDLTRSVNILVLGTDQREWDESARSDVIIVININPRTKKVNLLSIPRDARVDIPGHDFDKINAAYNSLYFNDGGPDLSVRTVENLLGLNEGEIPYFAVLNFNGFKEVINALGGVDIDVEEPMHYHSHLGDVVIDLEPGMQHLNGEKALEYARFRHDRYGDFTESEDGTVHGRVVRQQKLIKALINQSKSWNTIWKLPSITKAIGNAIYTNLTPSQISKIALLLRNDTDKDLNVVSFPGTDGYINEISYVIPDYGKLKEIGSKYFSIEKHNGE